MRKSPYGLYREYVTIVWMKDELSIEASWLQEVFRIIVNCNGIMDDLSTDGQAPKLTRDGY
ncbi:10322_t:CDS:2 [Rhizophagus irregularis]|nr:10322_t:CDS:2 [Rhizophagus irregularis]